MANQQSSTRSTAGRGAGGAPPSPPQPNVRAEELQRLVDQAAHFNIFSIPETNRGDDLAILARGSGNVVIGMNIRETLHRFDITVQPPTARRPLTGINRIGEASGKFTHRWMVIPDDFVATPNCDPPQTPLDTSRSQRFVMLDSVCTFGDGKDGFRGFGTGQTLPTTVNGKRQLLAVAIGNVMEGFGRFKDHDAGTYVYCGALTLEEGFTGNILLRIMDTQGTLTTSGGLPTLQSRISPPEPDTVYIIFRGQAVPSDSVTPRVGPGGQFQGLNVEQGLRIFHVDFKSKDTSRVQSVSRVGQPIGKILAHVNFNPTAPGGTGVDPIPFTTFDELTFFDSTGKTIGGFTGDSSEGRVFNILLAGQRGIRFGGTGRILNGTGPFAGIEGLLTDNSVVIFQPHVSASVYVLRINDPRGRFRAAINEE